VAAQYTQARALRTIAKRGGSEGTEKNACMLACDPPPLHKQPVQKYEHLPLSNLKPHILWQVKQYHYFSRILADYKNEYILCVLLQ
jgi:hypothetical protein